MFKCWGLNASGQLGDGTTTDRISPVDVNGLKDESAIALVAGDTHTCALMFTGRVVCWGENTYGQLGDGTTINSSLPVEVQSLPAGIVQLAAGSVFTCALTGDGKITCWGDGQDGRFGNGVTDSYLAPAEIVLIFTQDDPSPTWQPQFFDYYKSDTYLLDNAEAEVISGINKESQVEETAVIIKIEEYYLLALPNFGDESLKYFDQVIASFQMFMNGSYQPH
ncbi:MAG TPA: hypothetical protein VI451_21055 [Anaerolineales bacterium]|nr:hypothetical protein [Anaerolineales bacterium]